MVIFHSSYKENKNGPICEKDQKAIFIILLDSMALRVTM